MNNHRLQAASLVTAGVAVGGILAGTLGAHAADEVKSTTGQPGPHVRVHFEGGPGFAQLAQDLGVSQSKLRSAFENVHKDVPPPKKLDGPPSEAQEKAMKSAFAAALAKELGISQDKVEAALEKQHARMEAQRRADLVARLDKAVDAGTLTSDDKASVLKAFDAGILDGPDGPRLVVRHG
jgi:hypothetical protein